MEHPVVVVKRCRQTYALISSVRKATVNVCQMENVFQMMDCAISEKTARMVQMNCLISVNCQLSALMEARNVQIAENAFRLRSYVMETTIVMIILTNLQKFAMRRYRVVLGTKRVRMFVNVFESLIYVTDMTTVVIIQMKVRKDALEYLLTVPLMKLNVLDCVSASGRHISVIPTTIVATILMKMPSSVVQERVLKTKFVVIMGNV
jgi:hypothetical protein